MSQPSVPAPPALLTELIKKGAEYLKRHGVDSPRLSAELLLGHLLGMSRLDLYLQFDKPLTSDEVDALRLMFQRRGRREPLQHITGRCAFYDFEVEVSPEVLIPRPETETLLEVAFKDFAALPKGSRVLDLCTGSGILAIAVKRKHPSFSVTGSDLSRGALAVAERNGRALGADVGWVFSDLFDGLGDEYFDAVVSNPPYIDPMVIPTLAPEVRDFEPRLALDGGVDGLEFYQKFFLLAARHLKSSGRIYLEIGQGQRDAVAALGEAAALTVIETVPDLAGIPRVMVFSKRG